MRGRKEGKGGKRKRRGGTKEGMAHPPEPLPPTDKSLAMGLNVLKKRPDNQLNSIC